MRVRVWVLCVCMFLYVWPLVCVCVCVCCRVHELYALCLLLRAWESIIQALFALHKCLAYSDFFTYTTLTTTNSIVWTTVYSYTHTKLTPKCFVGFAQTQAIDLRDIHLEALNWKCYSPSQTQCHVIDASMEWENKRTSSSYFLCDSSCINVIHVLWAHIAHTT